MRLTIRGGTVVTALVDPSIERRDLVVEDGRIGTGRVGAARGEGDPAGEVLDATGCLLLPGLVCAHTHAYSALARGMPYRLAPPRDFVEILRRIWWRLDRGLDEASIRASARVAALEAVRAGTTTLVDHQASPNAIDGSLDIVAEAFAEVGIRSLLAYEVTDRDGPERAAMGLAENDRFLRLAAAGRWPLARGLVGAHASFTLSPLTLEACVELADRHGVGLHIHVAEDGADERDAERRFGCRVAERLGRAGAVTDRTLLAHAVHLDDAEAEIVRASGATIALNTRSNLVNRVGRARVECLGDRVALGTDGIGGDLFEESRTAYLVQHAAGTIDGSAWPRRALTVGAAAAGRSFEEPLLGRLEPGAPADIIVLDAPLPTPLDAATWPGHWAFGLSGASVRDVVVAGRVVVRDRRPTMIDAEAILADARSAAIGLWQRLDEIAEHPFQPGTGR